MLHERPVEATLCDGLDAAIREISQAGTRSASAAESVRDAADLLRALAGRVSGMIALSIGAGGAERPAGETIAAETAPGAGLFELATNDGESFAQAVAALAAALPTLADPPNEPVEAAPEPESGQGAPAPAAEIAPSDNVLLPADEAQQTATETGNPDNDTAPPQLASTDVSLSEAVLSQAFSDDYFSSSNFSGASAGARRDCERSSIERGAAERSRAAAAKHFDRSRGESARRSRRPVRAATDSNAAFRNGSCGHRGCSGAGRAASGTAACRAAAAGAGNSAPAGRRSARRGARLERGRADRAVQLAPRRSQKSRWVGIVNFLLTKSRPQYDRFGERHGSCFPERGEADQQRRCVCLLSRGLRGPFR